MKSHTFQEIVLPAILLILIVLLVNPTGFWMPEPVVMSILTGIVIVYIIYGIFVWRERAADERESLHRYIGARFAYLTGTSILIVGIIMQGFSHRVDGWLVGTLGAMIVAKAVGRIYSNLKH